MLPLVAWLMDLLKGGSLGAADSFSGNSSLSV